MKIKLLLVYVSAFLLVGCAGKVVDRFPDITTDVAKVSSVNVVADFIIVEDIAADDLGISLQKHEDAAVVLKQELGTTLNEKKVVANFMHVGSGVFYQGLDANEFLEVPEGKTKKEPPKYLLSEGFKSSGQEFEGFELAHEWATAENTQALNDMFRQAQEYQPTLKEGQTKVDPLVFSELPEEFAENDASHLLLINSKSGDISAAKSIGVGLTTGLLTAVLSGGTYIAASTAVSQTTTVAMLVELDSKELIWIGHAAGGGSKNIGNVGKLVINNLYKEVDAKNKRAAKKAKRKA